MDLPHLSAEALLVPKKDNSETASEVWADWLIRGLAHDTGSLILPFQHIYWVLTECSDKRFNSNISFNSDDDPEEEDKPRRD